MKKILLLSTMLMAVLFFTSNAIAVDTLEKISDSGRFIVGARDGAIPFGFHNDQNEHVGFSLDLAKEFHKALEEKLGKPLELKTIVVNPKTRIPLVANGNVNIVTGSATHTIPREDTVDFSLTFFLQAANCW